MPQPRSLPGIAILRSLSAASLLLSGLLLAGIAGPSAAADALPDRVPAGAALVVADQNEELQTLMAASGEQSKLAATVTYANFLGGPAILEAFRAGALDLASVGSAPPIQAQAAGETIPIVVARRTAGPDYNLAVRPGLTLSTLGDLRGKRITYAEGSGRQPFILSALKLAELSRDDVELIPLRVSDFPDAIRTGQVDVAVLNEPHFSRYLADFADRGASALPPAAHEKLPRGLTYLYASGEALGDPAKSAAVRDFVVHWIAANKWRSENPQGWVRAYYVDKQNLRASDGEAIVRSEGAITFPLLKDLIAEQQERIDLIEAAGDLPKPLDAREEFDLRFDAVIAAAGKSS